MKGKKRLIALLLSFLMVLSQMSVATFALDTVADEKSDQTVEEQAVEETQPEADVKTAAVETEPEAALQDAAEAEKAVTEPEAAQPAAAEPAKAEPAKAEEKKAEPEKVEAKEEAFDQSQTVDGVTVNVSAAKGVFPAGSKLSVSKVAVPDAVDTSDAEAAYAFDISILANGKKIQPDGKATVSFTTEEVADYDTAVYHMDGGAQKMSVSESGQTATVSTTGFSEYVVVLLKPVLNDKKVANVTFKLAVGDTITLNQILEKMGVSTTYADDPTKARLVTSFIGVSEDNGLKLLVDGEEPTGAVSMNYTCDQLSFKATKEGEGQKKLRLRINSTDTSTSIYDQTRIELNYVIGEARSVTFDLNGGTIGGETTIDPQDVPKGEKATKPEDPIKRSCTFEGWFLGSEEEPFDFDNTTIEENITLVAHYNEHHWLYSKQSKVQGKIYCSDTECEYHDGFTVTLDVNDIYNVKGVDVKVDYDPKDGFPTDMYKIGDIKYYEGTINTVDGFKNKEPIDPPTGEDDEGFYTARVVISKWNDSKGKFEGKYNLYKPFVVVSAAPEATDDLVYNDRQHIIADDGLLPEGTDAVVLYKHPVSGEYLSREDFLNSDIPAGEYTEEKNNPIEYVVLASASDDPEEAIGEGTVDVIIDKADPKVTEPTAKTLTYNGSAQPLVTAGEAEGGTMEYVIGKNDTDKPEGGWSADIPKGTDVGDYYVWYRVKGDKNHYDTYAEKPVKAVINKADPKITPPVGKTMTYNGQAQELVTAGTTTGGTMVYALGKDAKTVPEETANWTTSVPKGTEVGTYYIWYVVVGDKNYNPGPAPACVTSQIVPRQFTISYDLNGGKLNGQTGKVTVTVDEGTVITLPAPTRDGYKFDYWEGSKYNAGDKYTVTGDHTFKAVWKANSKGVNTGDSNDIAGLMALMIASIGALGAIGYRRRKEDQ